MTETKLEEKLIDNKSGYLKVPQAIKDHYGTPIKWPNPKCRVIRNDEEILEIAYTFDKQIIEKRKR